MELALSTTDLTKVYRVRRGPAVHALRGVSVELESGRTLGIVGESGCGKSTLARLIIGLEHSTSGPSSFSARHSPLVTTTSRARSSLSSRTPISSLDPRISVAKAIGEVLRVHGLAPRRPQRRARIAQLLDMVALGRRFAELIPTSFPGARPSGSPSPELSPWSHGSLVLDEPTSALDVSVRAEVINLLIRLQDELSLSYVFISHDLSTVRHVSDVIE